MDPPTDPWQDPLPGADRVRCPWIARVCAGGGSYSESFVGSTIFVSGRSPSARWSVRCSGGAQRQRSGIAAIACTWLTVPRTHELVLLRQQRSYGRASRRVLQRLRRAASEHFPHAQLVSRIVLAARARAERCREHPRSGSRLRCSGTDFAELQGSPQNFPEHKRHCFVVYRPCSYFLSQDSIFLRQGPEIFAPLLSESAMKQEG